MKTAPFQANNLASGVKTHIGSDVATTFSRSVIVCGGRDYSDMHRLSEMLGWLKREGLTIIEGGARGADAMARTWAIVNSVPYRTFAADWRRDGKAAGPIRNQRMLDETKPALVIAFPGGRGTADMVRRAERAGVTVIEVPAESDEGYHSPSEAAA